MTSSGPNLKSISKAVVRLPQTLRAGNLSMIDLVNGLGYFSRANEIGEDLICQCLKALPSLVDDWLCFSEDKRANTGWYFQSKEAGYEVGYFGDPNRQYVVTHHTDRFEACARFIKNELEEMRRNVL